MFTSQKGGAFSREQVHRIFKGIAERAGVPKGKRFVHILKHSRASHLVEASLALINPCGLGSIRLARMRIELDHLFVCTSVLPQALPKLKNVFGSVCARDLQISIPDKVQRTGVLPLRMP